KAAISLTGDSGATTLTVAGDVHAGGAIARVGQRIIKAAARLMMDRFFKRLKAIAEGRADSGAGLDAAEESLDEIPPSPDEDESSRARSSAADSARRVNTATIARR